MDKTRFTDSHEHPLNWFKPVYELLTVTEDNYTEELDKGLYTFIQGVEIKSGYEKIKFTYYSPEGKILAIETVPVLYNGAKGDPGEQGEQGATYKGIGHDAIGTGIRTPWVEGDTYINAADGYLYAYDSAERLWTKIPSYSDSRYNQAINDMIALSNNTGYDAEFLNVINLWVRNLTAQTALINQLFAKKMTLQEGGIIKSANYNGTANDMQMIDNIPEGTPIILDKNSSQGFAFDTEGNADISNLKTTNLRINNGNFNVENDSIISTEIFDGTTEDIYYNNCFGNMAPKSLCKRISGLLKIKDQNTRNWRVGIQPACSVTFDPNPSFTARTNSHPIIYDLHEYLGEYGYIEYKNVKYTMLEFGNYDDFTESRAIKDPYSLWFIRLFNEGSAGVTIMDSVGELNSTKWKEQIKFVSSFRNLCILTLSKIPTVKPDTPGIVYSDNNNLCIS